MVHSFDLYPQHPRHWCSPCPIRDLHSIGPLNAGTEAKRLSKPHVGRAAGHLGCADDTALETVTAQTGAPVSGADRCGLRANGFCPSIGGMGARRKSGDGSAPLRRPAVATWTRFDPVIRASAGWTAKDFAGSIGVSTGHLSRLCRAAKAAATPISRPAHVEEACRMLAFTRLSVGPRWGYRLGFCRPVPYFSRRFRTVQGRHPVANTAISSQP